MLITSLFSLLLIFMSFINSIRLTAANDTAAELMQKLEAAQEENRILRVRYESLHSLEEIEDYAVNELGMVGRSAGQTVYIELP